MFGFHDLVFHIKSQILTNQEGIKKTTTNIKSKLSLLLLSNWCVHTNQDTIRVCLLHIIILANHKGKQVCGHDW